MIVCEGCGGPLPTPAGTGRARQFCTPPCRARAHRRRTAHHAAEYRSPAAALYVGNARRVLARLPAASVHAVVTSPPYLGQRAYGGGDGQIGTERSLRAHLDALCAVINEVARVLRPDGTVWVNLADRYSGRAAAGASAPPLRSPGPGAGAARPGGHHRRRPRGSLLHVPARLGIALSERGWLTRNVITWHKPDAMPHPTATRLPARTETVARAGPHDAGVVRPGRTRRARARGRAPAKSAARRSALDLDLLRVGVGAPPTVSPRLRAPACGVQQGISPPPW